jgi:HEPN domain-containing protein
MNDLTAEWVSKAENDFNVAQLALEKPEVPITDAVCFHSQQCAEKYLKGFLQERQIEFRREHLLLPLLNACLKIDAGFEQLRVHLDELEGYAVGIRYPGPDATVEMAKDALAAATQIRTFIRARLGLTETSPPTSAAS